MGGGMEKKMILPLDIENKEFKKTVGGYNRDDVDDFMRLLLQDYKELYMGNIALKEKVATLSQSITKYKTMEDVLQNTLLVAQSTSDEVKRVANEKAQAIIEQAQAEATKIVTAARAKATDIEMETSNLKLSLNNYKNQMKAVLKSALELVDSLPESEKQKTQDTAAQEKTLEQKPLEKKEEESLEKSSINEEAAKLVQQMTAQITKADLSKL